MLQSDNPSIPTQENHSAGMSLNEKMTLWAQKDGADDAQRDLSQYFEGVGAFEEMDLDANKISAYSTAVMDSPTYAWLINILRRQAIYYHMPSKPAKHQHHKLIERLVVTRT